MVLLVYGNGLRKAHGFEMHEMSMAWRVFFFYIYFERQACQHGSRSLVLRA